jgi:protocatechuate 3,4-dioxygenase, beta subunit
MLQSPEGLTKTKDKRWGKGGLDKTASMIESPFFELQRPWSRNAAMQDATKQDIIETSDVEYGPYREETQLARLIDKYPRSYVRNPSQPLIERPVTLSERTGPVHMEQRLALSAPDISRATPDGPRAIGQYIEVTGRVVDEDGAPLAGSMIEIWQANSAGKYVHELDPHDAPIDPHFRGLGRFITDAEGLYSFRSIKPGGYPMNESDWWWRPPHIHFSIFGPSWMNRFVTQIFFPGEPLNETDLLLNAVQDTEARDRLIFEPLPTVVSAINFLSFRRDFVLRGKRRTPALD